MSSESSALTQTRNGEENKPLLQEEGQGKGSSSSSSPLKLMKIPHDGLTYAQRLDKQGETRCCCCTPYIKTQVSIILPCDEDTAYKAASGTDGLPRIFPGKGPIPGVKKAWIEGGGVQKVGAVRICNTTDGNEVAETYIQWEPPFAYAYEMTKLKAPLSLMLNKAIGTWEFHPLPTDSVTGGKRTKVIWTYFGVWTNVFIMPVTTLVVKVHLKAAMQLCLEKVREVVTEVPKPGEAEDKKNQ